MTNEANPQLTRELISRALDLMTTKTAQRIISREASQEIIIRAPESLARSRSNFKLS